MRLPRFSLLAATLVVTASLAAPIVWARGLTSEPERDSDSSTFSMAGVYASAGSIISLAQAVDQDVFLAGSQVSVDAPVTGDVFAAGSLVTIGNTVGGSVRAAGSQVTIDGTVSGNVLVFGSSIRITKNAVIEGDLNAYGASVVIDGTVTGRVYVAGADFQTEGTLTGPVVAEVDQATFSSGTTLGTVVEVNSPKAPVVAPDVTGAELIQYTHVESTEKEDRSDRAGGFAAFFGMMFLFKLFLFVATLVVGIVATLVAPKWFDHASTVLKNNLGKSAVWGLLMLFAAPALLITVAITLVGLPLALVAGMVYLLAIIAGKVVVSVWLGRMMLRADKGHISTGKLVGSMVLGAVVLFVLFCIPFLGMLVHLVTTLFGLGAVVTVCMLKKQQKV